MKMIAFMKYGDRAASTRQRLLQYLPALNAAGIQVDWRPLLENEVIRSRKTLRLLPGLAKAYGSRFGLLAAARDYDLIWIHKELFPYTPGWLEGLVASTGRPIVYDFDDAIFHNYDLNRRRLVRSLLGARFEKLLRSAAAVSCGNAYLQAYATQFCPNSIVIPTTIDTDIYVPRAGASAEGVPVIGWIGSPSTWPYVEPLIGLLEQFVTAGRARVRIVGSGVAPAVLPLFDVVEWAEATELADLQAMDIGIMPLTDDPWSRGKCGYKLIQYMACGLPIVASPVGVNADLAQPDNGMRATTPDEWREALERLIERPDLRRAFGVAGRRLVEQRYSLRSQAPQLIDLLYRAANR